MTDYDNAERLRKLYLIESANNHRKKNICMAKPNWNGCDYCDVYSGFGAECWKQNGVHNCCHVKRI